MPRVSSRRRIVNATLACIERAGLAKMSMVEVAEVAGLGRQTVYRHFKSRADLIEAAARARLDALIQELRPVADSCRSFEEALVRLNVESVRAVREDKLLFTILQESDDRSLERFMMERDSPVADQMMALWGPLFRRARAAGEIHPHLSDADIAAWVRAVQMILLVRTDLMPAEQAKQLRDFVAPAICVSRVSKKK